MTFEMHSFGPVATNSFLLSFSSKEKKSYIFDAPLGSCQYWEERARELSLSIAGLFLTHSHWDHIADAAAFKKKYHLPIWIHPDDANNLQRPGSDGLPLPFAIGDVQPDYLLEEGPLLLNDLSLTVIHTPGHTPGSVCFYFIEKMLLITGDTLFAGGIGRLDLPTAHPHDMKRSLQKLLKLPPNTQVFPGHGEPTSMGEQTDMIHYLCENRL